MIIFFGDGRLGNQLFQYSFIKSIDDRDHTIITYNFEDIIELFGSIENVINIQNKQLKTLIRKLALPLFDFLSKLKIISSYEIDKYFENGFIVEDVTFTKRTGLLPIKYVYPGFAQSEKFFKEESTIKNSLVIKEYYIKQASEFLTVTPVNFRKVFVHIRRGDYINYSVLGKIGATLPLTYYKNRIQWYEENIENPYFIFLTDDPEFVEYCFESIQNKIISNNSMFVDFAIISLCEYGIMSNSSFAWWASYMMKRRIKVFSPKYWLGWKSVAEFPKGVTPSFSEVVPIEK